MFLCGFIFVNYAPELYFIYNVFYTLLKFILLPFPHPFLFTLLFYLFWIVLVGFVLVP